MPRLITVSGKNIELLPGHSYLIGRDTSCDIVVDDCSCSRRHAKLTVRGADAQVHIEDAESRNGTFLNGRRLTGSTPVPAGGRIRVGSTMLLLLYEEFEEPGVETREVSHPDALLLDELPAPVPSPAAAEPPDSGIGGNLSSMSFIEVLQMLTQTRRSGTLDLESPAGPGKVEIRSGEVLAAKHPPLSGFAALHALAALRSGRFHFVETSQPCDRNIQRPTQHLLLELCRALDETSAVEVAKVPGPPETESSGRRASRDVLPQEPSGR